MSREKLDDLEKRAKYQETQAARAYARLEQLKTDIAKVEKGLKDLGLPTIEAARERIAQADEVIARMLDESEALLMEAEK